MARASAPLLVFLLGLSASSAAQEPPSDPSGMPLGQPDAPLPPPEQAPPVAAQAPQADRTRSPEVKKDEDKPKVPWHDTWLIVDNSVTAQTLGIGRSYQSSNPTYEIALSLRPRFYFYDTKEDGFYVSGRIDVSRELTNSDTTTQRGETLVGGGSPTGLGPSDPTLFTVYRHRLAKRGDYETTFAAFAPVLTFPLSKFSRDNNTYLGLGGDVRLSHDVPLAGSRSPVFKKLMMGVVAGYNHTFTGETTPTNTDLKRFRMDPEGRTVPGGQLTGAAFPMHEVRTTLRLIAEVAKDFSWWTDFVYQPTWLYSFSEVNVCVTTGCGPALGGPNPTTFVVVTGFSTSLYYKLINELTVGVGYQNNTVQPGVDGQRRNIFYSPGALFSLTLIGHLDEMYLTAAGRRSAD